MQVSNLRCNHRAGPRRKKGLLGPKISEDIREFRNLRNLEKKRGVGGFGGLAEKKKRGKHLEPKWETIYDCETASVAIPGHRSAFEQEKRNCKEERKGDRRGSVGGSHARGQ